MTFHVNRKACAVEAAARHNQDTHVFVLFTSPRTFYDKLAFATLQSIPNVFLRNVDLWSLAKGTPAEDWLAHGKLFWSRYLSVHTSDLVRLLVLLKYGGKWLDLDMVSQKSFHELPSNFVGALSDNIVGSGVLSVDHNGTGHALVERLLR